ncbi:MAG: dephospho-CoA kinase [Treponema sp.]|nr:dephospho-CoA kinase [Treponema sp.]MCL2252181.1 dephospho-CoA kinase [Treponema sp.]
MIIGLTGKYCAGKNFAGSLLEKKGLPVLDVDKLGYQVLEIKKTEILARFGNDLQNADLTLNRKALGQRVFGKPDELAALEAIVHPEANRLTEEWIAQKSGSSETQGAHCVINAALLHKSSVFHRFERIIIVTAPYLTRFFRARRRDRLSWTEIIRRFNSQKDFNSQYLSIKAEIYKVENPSSLGTYKALERQIDKFIEGIT